MTTVSRLREPKLFNKRHLVGARPGTLSVRSDAEKPRVRVIAYDEHQVRDDVIVHVDELQLVSEASQGVVWIDIQGAGDGTLLHRLAERFDIHPLALEDMANSPQRPKIVDYGDKLLCVTRMVRADENGVVDREQLAILLAKGLIITLQERAGDILDPVRSRIADGAGPIRKSGADYLAYALLDTVVDGYYPVIASINDAMEDLDERLMQEATPDELSDINQLRLSAVAIKRSISAQRLALRDFLRSPTVHVDDETVVHLKDTLDHADQIVDVMDNQRELLAGLLNTYLSMMSFQTNEVMKVLTIMASIFIPLTFIAGVYGMNFKHMPETNYMWAYPALLALMGLVTAGMVVFFVRKGWLGAKRRRKKRPG